VNIALAVPLADTWDMHGDIGTGGWIVMAVVMVLFWGAIILGIVWLVRGSDAWRGGRRDKPLDLLERRFAEGTISVEEYHERRDVLEAGTQRHQGAAGGDERAAPGTSGGVQ